MLFFWAVPSFTNTWDRYAALIWEVWVFTGLGKCLSEESIVFNIVRGISQTMLHDTDVVRVCMQTYENVPSSIII